MYKFIKDKNSKFNYTSNSVSCVNGLCNETNDYTDETGQIKRTKKTYKLPAISPTNELRINERFPRTEPRPQSAFLNVLDLNRELTVPPCICCVNCPNCECHNCRFRRVKQCSHCTCPRCKSNRSVQ